MKYNPKIHNRQSIRLKGWDYSNPGLYFITICTQNRAHLFGYIQNKKMHLNDAGKMIEKWYFKLEEKYPDIRCNEQMVMPNHFHCIIHILEKQDENEYGLDERNVIAHDRDAHDMDAHAGRSPRGRPETDDRHRPETNHRPETDDRPETGEYTVSPYGPDNKKYNASIFDMMDWFKTMTTNAYIRGVKTENWPRFEKRVWQKRYWDHIIRNENDYIHISNYIENNPKKWTEDKFNK